MQLTVASVLELESMRRARAEVLSGADALENQVSWAHISEMKHPGHLFDGGEFLLTQGRGIPRPEQNQREWVGELSKSGIAGVAIECGHVLGEVPQPVVEEARRLNLPLIGMSRPAYFMEITRDIHTRVLGNSDDVSPQVEEFSRRIARLLLSGAQLQEALDEVASAISHPVVITGPNHFLEFVSPRSEQLEEIDYDWRRHTKSCHELDGAEGVSEPGAEGRWRCLHRAVVFQGDLWGMLHVLIDSGDGPTELTRRILGQATISIGLTYAVQENLRSIGNDARSGIIDELLTTAKSSDLELERRLKWLGLADSSKLRALIAAPLNPATGLGRIANERQRLSALKSLSKNLVDAVGADVAVGFQDDRVAALVAAETDLDELQRWLQKEKIVAIVGASSSVPTTALMRAGKEAHEAVDYAFKLGVRSGLYRAEHLVLERAILKLNEDSTLSDLVEHELAPILDYDEQYRTSLFVTLETFFACAGRKNEMAQALHVDRRTVHHRLARVTDLLDGAFEEGEKLLALHLAVKGYRFLRRQR